MGGDRAGAHRAGSWLVMILSRNQKVMLPCQRNRDLLSTAPEQCYRNVPVLVFLSIRWNNARDNDC